MLALALVGYALWHAPGPALAQAGDGAVINREYPIKAAYLYNFASYVVWPETELDASQRPFVLGVMEPDPFGAALDQIAARTIGGRQVHIERIHSLEQIDGCHLLFIPRSADSRQSAAALRRAKDLPLLVVGEQPGFARQGAAINFVVEHNRVRFEINPEVARRQQLKISSKLLSLATIVESE